MLIEPDTDYFDDRIRVIGRGFSGAVFIQFVEEAAQNTKVERHVDRRVDCVVLKDEPSFLFIVGLRG
jgi:hypothetical protein